MYEKRESREEDRKEKRQRLDSADRKAHVSSLERGNVSIKEECSDGAMEQEPDVKHQDFSSRELEMLKPDMEDSGGGSTDSTSSLNNIPTASPSGTTAVPEPVCLTSAKETDTSGDEIDHFARFGTNFCKHDELNLVLENPSEHSDEQIDDVEFAEMEADATVEPNIASQLLDRADIIQASVELVTEAEKAGLDPTKLRLIEDYIHIHDQIVVNELAIEDFMAHIGATDTFDEDEAAKNLSLVQEAIVSINEAKLKRDFALAAVVDHGKDAQDAQHFQLTLDHNFSEPESHEHLALMYMELKRKNDELLVLQANVIIRLDPVTNRETREDALIEDFQQLLSNLSAELTSLSQLENQCQTVSIGLLESDNKIKNARYAGGAQPQ